MLNSTCNCLGIKPEVSIDLSIQRYETIITEEELSEYPSMKPTSLTNKLLEYDINQITALALQNELKKYYFSASITLNRGIVHDSEDFLYIVPAKAPVFRLYSQLN